MADRSEASKLVTYIASGAIEDVAAASKLVFYQWLEPGEDPGDDSNRQMHVFSYVVRRPS